MSKLYAFLRDSYREAVSGWMLQIMLAGAALTILFVLSVSFRPVTVRDQLDLSNRFLNRILPTSPQYQQFGSPTFSVDNYSQTNDAEPWNSAYVFDFVVTCPAAEDVAKAKDKGRQARLPVSRATTERFLKDGFKFLKDVTVQAAPSAVPTEIRFRVTAGGTTVTEAREWNHEPSVLFGVTMPLFITSLRQGIYFIQKWLVNGAGAWLTLVIAVVVTAGFVPNMLNKGALDLIVSKPVSKPAALVYKYLGGLTFVVIVATFTALGVWLAVGVRTGLWAPNFLATVPVLTLYFAVLYAVSTLAAAVTRNALVAILLTVLAWAVFWGVGKLNDGVQNRYAAEADAAERDRPLALPKLGDDGEQPDMDDVIRRFDPDAPLWGIVPKPVFPVVSVVHAVTPRTYELDARLGRVIAEGVLTERELKDNGYGKPPRTSWLEMVGVSLAFIAACLGLACWRVSSRDG